MNKILIIVDAQYDFLEGGNLGVEGATLAMDKLANFIREHGKEYEDIFLTADWHPYTHCSFEENGGSWPSHCVQHTQGAAIYQGIIDALNAIKADYSVLTKGLDEDHEEYSVFKNEDSRKTILTTAEYMNIDEIHVGGIALDVCVLQSIKDGKRFLPNVKWLVFKDFCASITQLENALKKLSEIDVKIF